MATEKANTQTEKSTRRQQPKAEPSPVSGLAPQTSPLLLDQAFADPKGVSPSALLTLQRKAGNRAVQRMLSQTAQRKSASGMDGGEVEPDLQNQIDRTRGGGHALDSVAGSQIGGSLGVDFSGVRVHTDANANTLNRSLNARAFTLGSDIYFSNGAYNPRSSSGKQLLAHELTHVVQQGAASTNKIQTKLTVGPASDKYEQEADRVATQVMRSTETSSKPDDDLDSTSAGGPHLQRKALKSPIAVSRLNGAGVIQGNFFKKAGAKLKQFGKKITNPFRTAFGKANQVKGEDTGSEHLDAMDDTQRTQQANRTKGSLDGATPDYTNPAVADQQPDRYVVTLAVAQEDTAWYENIKALKSAAMKSVFTSPKKLFNDPQNVVIRKALAQRGELDGKTEKQIKKLVNKFKDGIHDVGHTWVRLSSYVGNTLKDLYSYGMWPQKLFDPISQDTAGGYGGFVKAGPGQIRHPDTAHEGDPHKAYMDYTVTEDNFNTGLQKAVKRYNSPPPYVLTGYNCTAFAREIVRAAGGNYPGKGLIPGFAYTPGNLYWAVMKEWAQGNQNARTNDKERTTVEDIGKKTEERAEEAQKAETLAYKLKAFGKPSDTASRVPVTLRQGRTVSYGTKPNEINQSQTFKSDLEAHYVDDDDFMDAWEIVPVEFVKREGETNVQEYWYVEPEDFKKAQKKSNKKPEPIKPLPVPSDGLPYYEYRTLTPPTNPVLQGGFPPSKAPFLLLDQHHEGGWTSISERGTYYWVKTADWNKFMNPGGEVATEPEVDKKEESAKAYEAILKYAKNLMVDDEEDAIKMLDIKGDLLRLALSDGDERDTRAAAIAKEVSEISAEKLIEVYGPKGGGTAPQTTEENGSTFTEVDVDDEDEDLSVSSSSGFDEGESLLAYKEMMKKFDEYSGMDWQTVQMIVDTSLISQALADKDKMEERAQALADAQGTVTKDELIKWYGPDR